MSKRKSLTPHAFVMRDLLETFVQSMYMRDWNVTSFQGLHAVNEKRITRNCDLKRTALRLRVELEECGQIYAFMRHNDGRERWVKISNDSFNFYDSEPSPWSDWSLPAAPIVAANARNKPVEKPDDFSEIIRGIRLT